MTYADLRNRLARADYLVAIAPEPTSIEELCMPLQYWYGNVRATVRLRDLGVASTDIRRLVPSLRSEQIAVLVDALLRSHVVDFGQFVAPLKEYEKLVRSPRPNQPQFGLRLEPPTRPRLLICTLHVSAVADALNASMMQLVGEGEP